MKGSSHLAIGGAAGLGVALYLHTDPLTTASLIGIGSVAGLAPDLDVNGKLSNRITISKKWLILFFAAAGLLLIGYSYFTLSGFTQPAGFVIGLCLMLLPRLFIKQRTMLFVTGAALAYAAWYTDIFWLLLLSIFIIVSSFLAHRSLTHSIIGTACFAAIAWHFEQSVQLEGSFLAGTLAYASHLVADMKIWPVNKKGVKWFQPLFNKEF
ncbi:metal-dependent hydrolase [Bacillus aerolatus]|uniref:metal-dependent hydrolase n=1 Tax=Bacillus aerolatus TaxID=2653354 RepID=UPI00177C093E|nr:metal-dependent hydrolase [Bacillus aerolatus]